MSPFIVPSLKKIVGANLEKIDKVDFRDIHTHIHTYTQTYYSDLIGPFPYGGPTMNVGSRHFNRKVLKVE